MDNIDLDRFIANELNPRIYAHLREILPELQFKEKGDRYVSIYHSDFSQYSDYKEDRSVVTKSVPYLVFDNTRQEAKRVIDVYKDLHYISFWEALKRISSIVGILPPEPTQEAIEYYKKAEQRRTALEESAARQKEALFHTSGGKVVLDYLLSRGWTEGEIREAELGYISAEEATNINAQRSIGDFYKLSIPLRTGSTIYGFKFRTIEKDTKGKDKYTYLYGTNKKENLFNLTGIQQTDGAIVVVEGELDALHAQVRGLKGIVATGGGKLTESLLNAATERGIKRITFLFDKDERGSNFVRESIDIAHKKGISVLVATFPEGEQLKDGTPIHDIDEYLQAHSVEELQNLIDNAMYGSKYLLYEILKPYDGDIKDTIIDKTKDKVISLANHTPDDTERDLVLNTYSAELNINGKEYITAEALRKAADRERAREDEKRKKEQTKDVSREINALLAEDKVNEALKLMGDAAEELKKIGARDKYGDLLHIPTREERIKRFKEKPEALLTSYQFTEGGDPVPLTIPSGALTMLAAPTNHGKSTFLRNLAIDIAKRYEDEDKSILYFTFEECEEDVWAQFTNTYINEILHEPSKKYSQLDTIEDFYKTGETKYIKTEKRDVFLRKEMEFSTKYLDSGKITIFYRDYNLETLIEALEFAVNNIPTKAIFIDYIQILRSQKLAKQPRADQLKEICISLKNFSVKYKLPIIMAAQLNRDAKTPLRMDNTQIAESSDIEKSANTIVCLWNSQFRATTYGEKALSKAEKDELKTLEEKGFKLGDGGKIFAKLTKRRGRGVGMYSLYDFVGYSGKIIDKSYKPDEKGDEEPGGGYKLNY